jgi:hypothetical protein
MNRESFTYDTRAASETLGYLLIISMVLLSAGAIAVVGGQSIKQLQDASNQESADQAMTQFDSQMSLVAFQGGSEQQIDLSVNGHEGLKVVDDGHMTLKLKEINETDPTETDTVATLMDRDISSLEYQTTGEYTVAYQGGGVWSQHNNDPNRTSMISPPEFTYNERTATLPFVGINPDSTVSSGNGQVTLTDAETEVVFPQHNKGSEYQNPVDSEYDLVLTIQSEYYRAWGNYFEDRMGVTPIYHHDTNTIEVILVSEGDDEMVSNAVTSVEGDNRIRIAGQGKSTIVDSYNSDDGPYSMSVGDNGSVISEAGITIQNGEVHGDIETAGDLVLRGNARITGDAAVDGRVQKRGGGTIEGETTGDVDIKSFRPIDAVIEVIREGLIGDNDNDDDSRISGGEIEDDRELDMEDSSTTIHAGEYYLSEMDPNGEPLQFDLEDGDIKIVVDESIDLSGSDVSVVNNEGNDNRVQIYTRSDSITLTDVSTEGDEAPAIWFYGGAGTNVDVHGSMTGVIYAPGTSESPGRMTIHSHAAVYGATISGNTEIENKATYHYDEALQTAPIFTEPHHVNHISAWVSYFHISYTEIDLES